MINWNVLKSREDFKYIKIGIASISRDGMYEWIVNEINAAEDPLVEIQDLLEVWNELSGQKPIDLSVAEDGTIYLEGRTF